MNFPDKNNWTKADYITLIRESVKGRFDPLHWCQYITIESGLKSRPASPLLRGMGPYAFNKDGPASGLFQAIPLVQRNLGFVPGSADHIAAGGDFCKVPLSRQIQYSRAYLDGWRKFYALPSWGGAGEMYLCNFWPAGLKHRSEPEYVLVDGSKLKNTYKVNAGLDSGKKGWINVLDMTISANKALGYTVYLDAQKALVSIAQELVGATPDGIQGPLTNAALKKAIGRSTLNYAAWFMLEPLLAKLELAK